MFADVMEVKLRQWLIAVAAAITYSGLAASCAPQPVPAVSARAAARSAALQRQVEREAAQQEAAYGRMSDQERMRGIVYEPAPDKLPENERTKP